MLIRWPHKGAGFDPLIFRYLWRGGRVWFNAAVSKTAGRKIRGFKSHSLLYHEALSLKSRPKRKERRLKPARGQNTTVAVEIYRFESGRASTPFNQRGQNQDWSKSALRKHRKVKNPSLVVLFHSVKAGEWTA